MRFATTQKVTAALALTLIPLFAMGWFSYEATQAIRAREAGTDRHLPVVAMTAHAMAADRQRCLAAGMDESVSKPIQTKELVRVLDTLMAVEAVS